MKKERSINELEKLLNEKEEAARAWHLLGDNNKIQKDDNGDLTKYSAAELIEIHAEGGIEGFKAAQLGDSKWQEIDDLIKQLKKKQAIEGLDPKAGGDIAKMIKRQKADQRKYGRFMTKPRRGRKTQARTDKGRLKDSQAAIARIAGMMGQSPTIIDIGSGLGNPNPRLAGVTVKELMDDGAIRGTGAKIIATDVPDQMKHWRKLRGKYNLTVEEIPPNFNWNVDKLASKYDNGKAPIILRAANGIDLLMDSGQMLTHMATIARDARKRSVVYIFNNMILYKAPDATEFKSVGNIHNRGYSHMGKAWRTPLKKDTPQFNIGEDFAKRIVVDVPKPEEGQVAAKEEPEAKTAAAARTLTTNDLLGDVSGFSSGQMAPYQRDVTDDTGLHLANKIWILWNYSKQVTNKELVDKASAANYCNTVTGSELGCRIIKDEIKYRKRVAAGQEQKITPDETVTDREVQTALASGEGPLAAKVEIEDPAKGLKLTKDRKKVLDKLRADPSWPLKTANFYDIDGKPVYAFTRSKDSPFTAKWDPGNWLPKGWGEPDQKELMTHALECLKKKCPKGSLIKVTSATKFKKIAAYAYTKEELGEMLPPLAAGETIDAPADDMSGGMNKPFTYDSEELNTYIEKNPDSIVWVKTKRGPTTFTYKDGKFESMKTLPPLKKAADVGVKPAPVGTELGSKTNPFKSTTDDTKLTKYMNKNPESKVHVVGSGWLRLVTVQGALQSKSRIIRKWVGQESDPGPAAVVMPSKEKCNTVKKLNLSVGNKKLNVSRGLRYRKFSKRLIRPTQVSISRYLKNRANLSATLSLFREAPLAPAHDGIDSRYGYRTHKAANDIINDILKIVSEINNARKKQTSESRYHKLNQEILKKFNLQAQVLNEAAKEPDCCITEIEGLALRLQPLFARIQDQKPDQTANVTISASLVQDFYNLLLLVDLDCLFNKLKNLKTKKVAAKPEAVAEPEVPASPHGPPATKTPAVPSKAVARNVGACFDQRYRAFSQWFASPSAIFRAAKTISWEEFYKDLLTQEIFAVQSQDFSFGRGSVGYKSAMPGIFSYINTKKDESGSPQCLRVYLENLRRMIGYSIRKYDENRADPDVKEVYGGGTNSKAQQAYGVLEKAINYISQRIKKGEEGVVAPAAVAGKGPLGSKENPFTDMAKFKEVAGGLGRQGKRANKAFFFKRGNKTYKYQYDAQGKPPKAGVAVNESLKEKREKLLNEALFKKLVK